MLYSFTHMVTKDTKHSEGNYTAAFSSDENKRLSNLVWENRNLREAE